MKNLPWRDFIALVASIGVVGLGLGATIPLTALRLDQRGVGTDIIGMITAISALGILAVTPFVSRWVTRYGARACMVAAIVVGGLSTALMEGTDNLFAWGLLRFIFGACMGVLFTVGEAWVNHLAPGMRAAAWWPCIPPRSRYSSWWARRWWQPWKIRSVGPLPLPAHCFCWPCPGWR